MAFGFTPKHIRDFNLDGLDKEHFLLMVVKAASELQWNVYFISERGIIVDTKTSWTSWGEKITVKFIDGVANIKSECAGSQFFDNGKNKRNVESLIETIDDVKAKLTREEIESELPALRSWYPSEGEHDILGPPLTAKQNLAGCLSFFKPTEGYFITPILIGVNILLFIAMVVSGTHFLTHGNQGLLDWGANCGFLTLDGQWWRLFTSCFLHIGVLHLLLNMYALFYIGLVLEPELGKARFLSAYLISGVAAGLTSLCWNYFMISAGASGAVAGMYGVFLALSTTNLFDKAIKKDIAISITLFVVYNLIYGMKSDGEIDNAAHVGGFLSGVVVGYAFVPSLRRFDNSNVKFSTIGALTAVLLVASFCVYTTLPSDFGEYKKKMLEFHSMESKAQDDVLELTEGVPVAKTLSEIKRGVYYWNECLKLVESCNELNLPPYVRARTAKLRKYCKLRIESVELLCKSIEEGTDKYQGELDECYSKIVAILVELNGK